MRFAYEEFEAVDDESLMSAFLQVVGLWVERESA